MEKGEKKSSCVVLRTLSVEMTKPDPQKLFGDEKTWHTLPPALQKHYKIAIFQKTSVSKPCPWSDCVLSSVSWRIKHILERFHTAGIAYTDKEPSDKKNFQDILLKIVNSYTQLSSKSWQKWKSHYYRVTSWIEASIRQLQTEIWRRKKKCSAVLQWAPIALKTVLQNRYFYS